MPFDIANNAMNNMPKGMQFYMGTVINNNDPLGIDRIQVNIPGFFDNAKGAVPWCLPVKSGIFGQGNGYGQYGVPPVGSTVVVVLQQNNAEYPVYLGSLQNSKGEGFGSPNLWGFTDPNGNTFKVNTSNNEMSYVHSSGVTINIKDGNINITCVNDISASCNNMSASCKNATVNASSGANINTPTATFSDTVKCKKIVASDSMQVAGIEMKTHVHGGVDRGNSSTDGPH